CMQVLEFPPWTF
nr:immunoglobulin light chain junction region [Macaca mulatta]